MWVADLSLACAAIVLTCARQFFKPAGSYQGQQRNIWGCMYYMMAAWGFCVRQRQLRPDCGPFLSSVSFPLPLSTPRPAMPPPSLPPHCDTLTVCIPIYFGCLQLGFVTTDSRL